MNRFYMFFKKKKNINDDILSQIKEKISGESTDVNVQENDLLGSLMDTSDGVVIQQETAAQANEGDESIDILNNMVADVISKNNQEQAEIEDIVEDDILNDDILDSTTDNVSPATTETSGQPNASDDDLLNDLLDNAPAQSNNESKVATENTAKADENVDDLLGNLLTDKPHQSVAPIPVSEAQQTQQIEEAENYDDLLGKLLDNDDSSAKTEQEAAVKAEEEKFDSNSLLDNLISKVDESVLEDKPVAKPAEDNIEETITNQFVPVKQTMVHKDDVPEEVAVADDKYDIQSDDLLNSVIGTAKDEKLIEQEKEVPASQIADKMDELLEEAPKKEEKNEVVSPKAIVKVETKPKSQVSSKIEEGTKNGVKRSITELIENVKNQIICERETRTAQASSKTLEQVVGDLIQPKIVAFLNENLERIVEDVVHREINKIIRGIDEEK